MKTAEHEEKCDMDATAGERRKKDLSSRERERSRLVDLLDAGTILATTRSSTARETTGSSTAGETARSTTSTSVELLHDGVGNTLELLLPLLVLLLGGFLRVVEPADDFVDGGLELGLVSSVELVSELLVGERVTEVVSVGLETVLGGDTSSGSVILS